MPQLLSRLDRFENPGLNYEANLGDPIMLGMSHGWLMNEGTGYKGYDLFRKGRDISWSFNNDVSFYRSRAFKGNGTNTMGSASVDLSTYSTICTISFWYFQNSTSEATDALLFEHGPNINSNPPGFFFNPLYSDGNWSGKYLFACRGNNGFNDNGFPRGGVGWHHIVVSWNWASGGSEMVAGWLDGVQQTISTYATLQNDNTSTSWGNYQLYFGARSGNIAPSLGGLANFLIWNRLLRADEVLRLWTDPYCVVRPQKYAYEFVYEIAAAAASSFVISRDNRCRVPAAILTRG